MKLRSLLVILVLLLLVLFAIVNWQVVVEPTSLSLLVTHVEAPLGLVMLGFTAVLVAVLLGYAFKVQVTALADTRRQAAELRQQRELADRAEASRVTELRSYLEKELAALRESQQAAEQRLHDELAGTSNALSAAIGEVDERIERQFPTPPEQMP